MSYPGLLGTRSLSPLNAGGRVLVQNKTGNYPLQWNKTGRVVESRDTCLCLTACGGELYTTSNSYASTPHSHLYLEPSALRLSNCQLPQHRPLVTEDDNTATWQKNLEGLRAVYPMTTQGSSTPPKQPVTGDEPPSPSRPVSETTSS